MKNIFKASMDSYSNEITAVVTMLFVAIFIAQAIFHLCGNSIAVAIFLILLLVYLRAYLLRPLSYEITNDFLIIHRLANDIVIPGQNLNEVNLIDKENAKCTTGSFAIFGFFGYYGKFANKQIGSFTTYATRRDKTVLIRTTDNKKVILTPDKPAKFVFQLKKLIPAMK